ncbi:hypothetical protein BOTBODRAFT_36435 [Botryobasidium botryosum FD-172 SS1]|uniref:Alpha/beta hydrolase fold-3 domain-containing protein n=1 Tax=Botryobasidium botryosum (strain FD-172 SS1) TaxID=930990 RepID=A0A067M3J9_BOTB1|nr:hypothetical protein BOTBODRAFT_36435 [Botryobasidium botryosum FD-172 SS1]
MAQLFYLFIKLFRRFFDLSMAYQRWKDPSICPPPDLKKYYIPGHPNTLPTFIHLPASYEPGKKHKYPLLVNIHGGAFCMGTPELDCLVSKKLADAAECVVVNVNYRKAPEYPFPAGLNDVEAAILAVLADADADSDTEGGSLPMVDKERVALMGSSAGGALALSAALNPELQKRGVVRGIVAVMAMTDCTLDQKQRMDSLPRESGGKDVLKDVHLLVDAYMRSSDGSSDSASASASRRRDPRASPAFADPGLWPARLMFVTARMDCLYGEQERLVRRIREVRGGDGGVTWKVLEGLGHPSRDVRTGEAAEKWDEVWRETAAYLQEVWKV